MEKSEKSNEFGVTVKETDTNYPIITAVQKGELFNFERIIFLEYSYLLNGS